MKSLDPSDWVEFQEQAHQMLGDILDYVREIRERPVWQPIPEAVRQRFRTDLPAKPSDLSLVHDEFMRYVLPFTAGNVHPQFFGWVHGAGTPVGIVAEMLAAGLNANLAGRDHIPIEIEREVTGWMRSLFGFPEGASGLFVTGTSMANLVSIVVARDAALGFEVRSTGIAGAGRLTAYASEAVHDSICRALDIAGIGADALRKIPVDEHYRIELQALRDAIERDRASGFTPFLLVGTAGTVDTAAIDDLHGLADLARAEQIWFHVDGAFGALGVLSPDVAPRLKGIAEADSLAFDFHKWGQVPYDAGFVLIRDSVLHRRTFDTAPSYLRREKKGLAAGSHWPCEFGPDLSRGFRALKTWFTFKVYGSEAMGAAISRTCELARYLERRIVETPELELAAPVELNVVCFRYRANESDIVNARIVVDLQESGVAAPSTTTLKGKLAIRVAIVNHRTCEADLHVLLDQTLAVGRTLAADAQWLKRAKRERALSDAERFIAENPDALGPRMDRARLLYELGHTVEARDAYLEILKQEPSHRVALNNLGAILLSTGHKTAARTTYTEAVARHPNDAMSHINLANVLYEAEEFESARRHYETALRCAPDMPEAHQGLSFVLTELGFHKQAAWHRKQGFQSRSVIPLQYRGDGAPIRLLQIISVLGGNIPATKLLDDRTFETTVIVAECYDRSHPLPPHHLVLNAIGDADLCGDGLRSAESIVKLTDAPVLNFPAAVLKTGRSENARRLATIPGVITPRTLTLSRETLSSQAGIAELDQHGLTFPLLLRTPGFHTGRHFVRVENQAGVADALSTLPGDELTAIEYLDARGLDGKVRKYRVMMIDSCLYPLHVAVSSDWKVHYFTAEMSGHREHQAEDAAFLENMPAVLGPRAMAALDGIQRTMQLDYAGIDFGLSPSGDLLLFEANATMVVNPPEGGEEWAYRRPAVERIFAAIRSMLLRKAGSSQNLAAIVRSSEYSEQPLRPAAAKA